MFDYFGIFEKKKPNFQNGQKAEENEKHGHNFTFLAKPLDKHGITLVHIMLIHPWFFKVSRLKHKPREGVDNSIYGTY